MCLCVGVLPYLLDGIWTGVCVCVCVHVCLAVLAVNRCSGVLGLNLTLASWINLNSGSADNSVCESVCDREGARVCVCVCVCVCMRKSQAQTGQESINFWLIHLALIHLLGNVQLDLLLFQTCSRYSQTPQQRGKWFSKICQHLHSHLT